MSKVTRVLGIMSGTSLDGLDLALCEFSKKEDCWSGKISKATTIPYSDIWLDQLSNAHLLNGYELYKLDNDFGAFIGHQAYSFCKDLKTKPNFVSSHGHTIFHNPAEGISLQIGNGATIAAKSGMPVVCNFRTLDVALGGQGAPLVPIGDSMLFSEFDFCLNLGGFANVSYTWYKKRIAYDICPVNFIINFLVKSIGLEFDDQGKEAKKGTVNPVLLKKLNSLAFYSKNAPKSLGREWVESEFIPVLDSFQINFHDKLRTVYEHIAFQLSRVFTGSTSKKVLVTGGGAYNSFLIELLKKHSNCKIVIPEKEIIEYKEALIFAFLGLLRTREENNCLSSVTGAKHDCSGGVIYKI